MAFGQDDNRFTLRTAEMSGSEAHAAGIDVGLRKYMLSVYNYMAGGIALTGLAGFASVQSPALINLLYQSNGAGGLSPSGLGWIAMLAPLAFVLVLSFGINKMKASTAQALFWAFAAVMGVSLTHVGLTFTGTSIVRVFFITAGTFAGMSLYGYTTKRDLTGFGSFLMMGLIGLIIASVVNIFMQSSALHFVISAAGVLIFVGLTAYDTQKIKLMYAETDGSETMDKKAIMGALTLYLDFINLFLMLLRLFGDRR